MQGVAEPTESRTRPTTATISRIPRKVLLEVFSFPDDNLYHNQTLLTINQLNFDCRNLSLPAWSDAARVPDEDAKQAASTASPTSRRQQEDAKVFHQNHNPQSSSISSSSLRSRYTNDTSPLNRSKSVPKPFSSVSLSVPETVKKGRQFLMNTCYKRKRNKKLNQCW